MKQRLCRVLAAPVVVAFLHATLAPAVVAAQGFDFTDEEEEDFGEPMDFTDDEWGDDEWSDDDVMEFGDDGWDDVEDGDDGWGEDDTMEVVEVPNTITGLIVPSADFDATLADQLTATLIQELGTIEGNEVVSNEGLRQEFEIMGGELATECAFDPVCLGRYGRELGLGRVVVGRVESTLTGWATTIDLFETETSSIINYRYFETEGRLLAVQEALPAQLPALFGIRAERNTGSGGPDGPSTAQVAMAWTTAGLAVGAIATGVVFGLSARSTESDLQDCTLVDDFEGEPVCQRTQVESQPLISDAKSDARLSNILIGGGLFLGVLSVVLFTVTPGGDIDEDAELVQRRRNWRLAPAASRDGFGLSGSWNF